MAAPLLRNILVRSQSIYPPISQILLSRSKQITNTTLRQAFSTPSLSKHLSSKVKAAILAGGCAIVVGTGFGFVNNVAAEGNLRPPIEPSKTIRTDTDKSGLKLTLYQYVTCPFCCKIRAYLDYYGYNYDVIEVNSVTRAQTKWSKYGKIPIVCADGIGQEGFVQLNDSSVIMSILSSNAVNPATGLEKLISFYPCTEKKERGRTKYEFQNKYHVMYGEAQCAKSKKELKEEIKWRKWTDDVLMHVIAPNCYRSPSEALQAFHNYSDIGDWEKEFTSFERRTIIYVGAFVMYVLGKYLKRKYKLKADVRESLYETCDEWVAAVGKTRQFMGGSEPNLADLSVYGVLSSMEGCIAFQDALVNSNIGDWYYRTKAAVQHHGGAATLTALGASR